MTTSKVYIEAFEHEVGPVMPNYKLGEVSRLSTGLASLDFMLDGGIPGGQITELLGPESSAKSTLALHLLAEHGGVLIDADGSYDPVYAEAIGVPSHKVALGQITDVMEIDEMVRASLTHTGWLVVIDSLGALTCSAADLLGWDWSLLYQLEGLVREWLLLAHRTGGTIVLVDQLRFRPPWGNGMRGSMRTTSGPIVNTLSALRLEMSGKGWRNRIGVVVRRDTHHPYQRTCTLDLEDGCGFSRVGSYLDWAVKTGVIVLHGSWYSWAETGEIIGQGREQVKEMLC